MTTATKPAAVTVPHATLADVVALHPKLVWKAYRAMTSQARGKKATDYGTAVQEREETGRTKSQTSSHTRTANMADAEDAVQTLYARLAAKPPEWWYTMNANCYWAFHKAAWIAVEQFRHKSYRQQLLDEEQADLLLVREVDTVLFDIIEGYTPDEQSLMNGLAAGYSNAENIKQLEWTEYKYWDTLKGIRVKGLLYSE